MSWCACEAREAESGLRRAGRRPKTSFSFSPLSLSRHTRRDLPQLASSIRQIMQLRTKAHSTTITSVNCNHDLSAKRKTGKKGRPPPQSFQSPRSQPREPVPLQGLLSRKDPLTISIVGLPRISVCYPVACDLVCHSKSFLPSCIVSRR